MKKKKKKKSKNLPEVGKLYRLFCESGIGERYYLVFGLNLEENLLVCIPNTYSGGRPVQSFLVSGTGEIFRWCFTDTEHNRKLLLKVGVVTAINNSGWTAWLEEEVDTDVE